MSEEKVYMIIDLDRCWGCKACEVACKQELGLGVGFSPMKIIEVGPREIDGKLQRDFVPTMCQHCSNPACLEVCAYGAISRELDGTVQIADALCIGCGLCLSACPYGAIGLNANKKAVKCTLCVDKRRNFQLPSCVQHCPGRAIKMITENELTESSTKRFRWTTGRMVYVSDKWTRLGNQLDEQ